MKNRSRFAVVVLALFCSLAGTPARDGCQNARANHTQGQTQAKGKVVYVCACLKTKSCSCMTEAKTEGPCACGTEGGPPMKAVAADSAWAKANRQALTK